MQALDVTISQHPKSIRACTRSPLRKILLKFRLFPFRSPLLREYDPQSGSLFSLPRATKMFQFARLSSHALYIQAWMMMTYVTTGFPHSDIPGSQVGCHLPEAYRRLRRPSSFVAVEASTIRPWCSDISVETRDSSALMSLSAKSCDLVDEHVTRTTNRVDSV